MVPGLGKGNGTGRHDRHDLRDGGKRHWSVATESSVTDNPQGNRFELAIEGQTAVLNYERTPTSLVLVHTEVPASLRGRHLGDRLVEGAIAHARQQGLRIVAVCRFVRAYLRKHPEHGIK